MSSFLDFHHLGLLSGGRVLIPDGMCWCLFLLSLLFTGCEYVLVCLVLWALNFRGFKGMFGGDEFDGRAAARPAKGIVVLPHFLHLFLHSGDCLFIRSPFFPSVLCHVISVVVQARLEEVFLQVAEGFHRFRGK